MVQTLPLTTSPVVAINGVTKRFPGVIANDHIDLGFWAGEVHVLLGENGAGKSTLVGMLAGLQQPDQGFIAIDGRVKTLNSPRHALRMGIGTVFQHAMMVPGLSIVDNIALGDSWWRRPARALYAEKIDRIARDIGVRVDPFALAGSLSLGEQQQAEIVRILLRGSRLLILDEATAMLTPKNARELGQLMRRMVAQGLAVVFITHKLNEALAWGDRISVLRKGKKVGDIAPQRLKTLSTRQATDEIMQLMFNLAAKTGEEAMGSGGGGADADAIAAPSKLNARFIADYADAMAVQHTGAVSADVGAVAADAGAISADAGAKPVLAVRNLTVDDPLMPVRGIDLAIRAGEILGIAGIDGNGQKQLAEALAGQRPLAGGHIYLAGEPIEHLSVGQRRQRGLRYVTDDRLGEGTVASFPIATNLLLKQIGAPPYWRRGIEQPSLIARHARDRINEYDIRTPAMDTPLGKLSGGNIQKTLLARELGGLARAVIFAKPTHGLDVQNTLSIRQRIRQAAQSGVAVILISTDLEELLALSDRIAVISRGKIVGQVNKGSAARAQIGELMSEVAQ